MNSHPFEWFDLFMPQKRKRQMNSNIVTLEQLTTWSYTKAILHNVGEGGVQYENFQMFTVDEIMSFHGLYMHNGLSPSPQVEYKFASSRKNLINESKICEETFGRNVARRLREFKAFSLPVIQQNLYRLEHQIHIK